MTIQTLVVTTQQTDHSLFDKMNIQTDAVIGNQCDRDEVETVEQNGHRVRWMSLKERGVGLNRNTVMMRSDADICVFADDDMVFHDGYPETVAALFEQYPDADVILFNLDEKVKKHYHIPALTKVNKKNYGRYGAARLAFRREKVFMAGVTFHLMFGGGAPYSSGEDSIFLHDCLQKKLKMIAVPTAIAELHDDRESTWFEGYNDKFFYDKGVLYAQLYGKKARLVALYNCFKHRHKRYRSVDWKNAYRQMCKGIKNGR